MMIIYRHFERWNDYHSGDVCLCIFALCITTECVDERRVNCWAIRNSWMSARICSDSVLMRCSISMVFMVYPEMEFIEANANAASDYIDYTYQRNSRFLGNHKAKVTKQNKCNVRIILLYLILFYFWHPENEGHLFHYMNNYNSYWNKLLSIDPMYIQI